MTWATGAAVAVRHERRRHEKRSSAACPRPTELNLPTSPMSYSSSPILPQTSPSGPLDIPEIYVCKLPLLQIIVVSLVLGAILLIVGLVQLKPGAGASQHKFVLLGSGVFLLVFGVIMAFIRCCLLPWSIKKKRRKLLMDEETALQNGASRTRTPSHSSLQTPNHNMIRSTTITTSTNNVISTSHHHPKPHSNPHHHHSSGTHTASSTHHPNINNNDVYFVKTVIPSNHVLVTAPSEIEDDHDNSEIVPQNSAQQQSRSPNYSYIETIAESLVEDDVEQNDISADENDSKDILKSCFTVNENPIQKSLADDSIENSGPLKSNTLLKDSTTEGCNSVEVVKSSNADCAK